MEFPYPLTWRCDRILILLIQISIMSKLEWQTQITNVFFIALFFYQFSAWKKCNRSYVGVSGVHIFNILSINKCRVIYRIVAGRSMLALEAFIQCINIYFFSKYFSIVHRCRGNRCHTIWLVWHAPWLKLYQNYADGCRYLYRNCM